MKLLHKESSVICIGQGGLPYQDVSIFYEGENIQSDIDLSYYGWTVYFYSEIEPTESGKYWHYVNDIPTSW